MAPALLSGALTSCGAGYSTMMLAPAALAPVFLRDDEVSRSSRRCLAYSLIAAPLAGIATILVTLQPWVYVGPAAVVPVLASAVVVVSAWARATDETTN